jgi:hypothetical protein
MVDVGVGVACAIKKLIELLHLPREVIVMLVAQSLTETTFPFSNSAFESIAGLANPTSAVIEKSGPSPSPIPAFNVNKISIILFEYIHSFS